MGNDNNSVELLAPAGNMESFIAAVNAGADAVYMGLNKFNARVMANNFTFEEYEFAIDYAHKRNVKVYLTLNTLLLDDEIKEALENVIRLYEYGLDAVIVQDLGLATLIHKLVPNLALHASTQMSICTLEQAKEVEQFGFKRVVLARELSIKEIEKICKGTNLEIEVFVHGALCVSVSGQCLMSALIGSRSANKGSCAGTCRKKYSLYNNNGKCILNKYILSKKDIFGMDKLNLLKQIGVKSFKVEGRNKTPEYVAGVIREYRNAIDYGYNKEQDKKVLQLFNRSGKSDGYLEKVRYKESISVDTPKNTGLVLGKALKVKGKYIKVKLEQDIALHDGIEVVGENISSSIVTCIRNEEFKIINKKVEKGSIVYIGDISNVNIQDTIYKTSDSSLNSSLEKFSKENMKRINYKAKVIAKKNNNICVTIEDCEKITLDYIPQISKTSSINLDKVKEAFSKTQDTSVIFDVCLECEDNLFVPTSILNELRKKTVSFIEDKKVIRNDITGLKGRIDDILKINLNHRQTKVNSLYVYRYSESIDYIKYYREKYNNNLDVLYISTQDFKYHFKDIIKYIDRVNVYFVISNVTLYNETMYIKENLEKLIKSGVKGVLLGNIGFLDFSLKLKEKYNIKIGADYSLNILNKYTSNVLKECGVDYVCPLFEDESIDLQEMGKIIDIELVQDLATAMTTRYCVISSFSKNSKDTNLCQLECTKNDYYLIDEQDKHYDIITNRFDCISKFVRNKKKYSEDLCRKYSERHCIL